MIGFHTRNVPHVGHEYLHCESLRSVNADGILLSPVIGPKKKGDFSAKAILESYSAYVTNHPLLRELAVIAPFNNYSRFAGPREAIFTAICRRNMGCTHFIIGRDHTGIGENYDPRLLDQYLLDQNSLGIEIIQFDEIGWCKQRKEARPFNQNETIAMQKISGTVIRQHLREGTPLPERTLADGVESALRRLLDDQIDIFES